MWHNSTHFEIVLPHCFVIFVHAVWAKVSCISTTLTHKQCNKQQKGNQSTVAHGLLLHGKMRY